MIIFSFSFDHFLYFILYALSSFSQIKMIELLEIYPHMILMLFSSLSMSYSVILEDISLFINEKECTSDRNSSIGKLLTLFNKKKFAFIQAENREKAKLKCYAISISILTILTALNISLSYLLFLCLFTGFSGVICIFNNLITWVYLFFWAKRKIYRHYILAFTLLVCALTASFIFDGWLLSLLIRYFGSKWLLLGFFILTALTTASREVLEKYLLDVLYMSSSRLLFYEGIGTLIATLLVFTILQFIPCVLDEDAPVINITSFCLSSKAKVVGMSMLHLFSFISLDTLYIWIYIISTFINELFRILINKKHGPTHRYSADLFAFAIYMIVDMIISYYNDYYQIFDWKRLIVIMVLILGCLIYNENIRINLCNLSYYTRAEIERRAAYDTKIDEDALIKLQELDEIDYSI